MFRPRVKIPNNAPIFPLYDIREIDGATSELNMFGVSPDKVQTNNNYTQNPVPTDKNLVILAIAMQPTILGIKSATNIDPTKVLNNLSDSVLEISTDRSRQQALEAPIEDFMDLEAQVSAYHNGTSFQENITLRPTKPRHLDNLFKISGTSWSVKVNFATGDFPAETDWNGAGYATRFGLKSKLFVVEFNDEEMEEYERRLEIAANS